MHGHIDRKVYTYSELVKQRQAEGRARGHLGDKLVQRGSSFAWSEAMKGQRRPLISRLLLVKAHASLKLSLV